METVAPAGDTPLQSAPGGPCPRYPLAGGDPTPEHLPVSQPSTRAVPGGGAGAPGAEAEGRGVWLHADLGEQPCLGHLGFWTQGSEETGLKRPREPSLATLLLGSWAAPQEAQKEVRRPIRKGKRCRIHSCLQNISRFGQRFRGARWAVPGSGPRAPTDTAPPRDTQE